MGGPIAPVRWRLGLGALLMTLALAVTGCADTADTATGSTTSGEPPPAATDPGAPDGTAAAVTDSVAPDDSAPASGSDAAAAEATVAPPAEPAGAGECTIQVSGDVASSVTFPQEITSFSTDYWVGEDELRQTVEFLGEDIAGGSYDEIVGRGEPIVTFLQVACTDPEDPGVGALVTLTTATTSSDIPMGPGSYPITGGIFDADGPAATAIADYSLSADEVFGTVADSGTLDIARWDLDGIQGTFAFDAQEIFVDSPRRVRVEASFSFVCADWFSGC